MLDPDAPTGWPPWLWLHTTRLSGPGGDRASSTRRASIWPRSALRPRACMPSPSARKRVRARVAERYTTRPTSVFSGIRKVYNGYQSGERWSVEPRTARLPRGQSCLGRLPSRLRTAKMAFRRLWHAIEVPQAPSAATQTHGWPSSRASTRGESEVLAGYLPAKTARCPPRPRRGRRAC